MKVYHYARLDNWNGIKNGSDESRGMPGLTANRRLGLVDPEAWNTGAGFALMDPSPSEWTESQEFPNIWKHLQNNVGALLLEIDVDPQEDGVFVVERAHMEGFLYNDKQTIPERYQHATKRAAEQSYFGSMIGFGQYLEQMDQLGYLLPEVIFTQHVPFDRLTVSETQPKLEEALQIYRGDYKAYFERTIKSIPELSPWYSQYKQEQLNPEGVTSIASKEC